MRIGINCYEKNPVHTCNLIQKPTRVNRKLSPTAKKTRISEIPDYSPLQKNKQEHIETFVTKLAIGHFLSLWWKIHWRNLMKKPQLYLGCSKFYFKLISHSVLGKIQVIKSSIYLQKRNNKENAAIETGELGFLMMIMSINI